MDTVHCSDALNDKVLYSSIIQHRATFTKLKEVDYNSHRPEFIDFVPPEIILKEYKRDYNSMQESMIYGESPSFESLIERIIELRSRFRKVKF